MTNYAAELDAIKERAAVREKGALLLACIALPVFACAFWLLPSYFEAKTYSKLTGAEVTMWDAMWVDLRVQESPAPSDR